MRYDDALALHTLSGAGVSWQDSARWLGDRNVRLAAAAHGETAKRAWFRFAAACYRFGQVAIPTDTTEKKALHAQMVDVFARAAALDYPVTEKLEIPWRNGKLSGWLMRPTGARAAPVVIIMGGFDGWREEYYLGAVQLVQHGIAAALIDGPGQGETRLRFGLYLDVEFHLAFSAIGDYLRGDPRLNRDVAIWGNSLGGFLAARTVAADPSFKAVCINGGSIRPIELPERFPRFWNKVEALVGSDDRSYARSIMEQLDLDGLCGSIRCPLLQLHGVPDTVFLLENARRIHDQSASLDKTLLVWEDGDHCIYNHSEEKNLTVADWFASRLATTG